MSGSPFDGLKWWQHVLLFPLYAVLGLTLLWGKIKDVRHRRFFGG